MPGSHKKRRCMVDRDALAAVIADRIAGRSELSADQMIDEARKRSREKRGGVSPERVRRQRVRDNLLPFVAKNVAPRARTKTEAARLTKEALDVFKRSLDGTGDHRSLVHATMRAIVDAGVPYGSRTIEKTLPDQWPRPKSEWRDLDFASLERGRRHMRRS